VINGERIRFRAAEREDLPTFVAWINDPEVRAGISLYLPMSMASEEKWFENMLERHPDEQPLVIEARHGKGWKTIGNCGFFDINSHYRSAEFGIMIGEKSMWNQGYGTEAVKLLLRHGFETLNLNRIMLRVFENNPHAIRTYEKAGFTHEGRLRQAHYTKGQYVDVLLMSVLRSEWKEA